MDAFTLPRAGFSKPSWWDIFILYFITTLTLACICRIPPEQCKGNLLPCLFILHLQCFGPLNLRFRNWLMKVLCGTMWARFTCGLLCSRFTVMWLTDSGLGGILQAILPEGGFQQYGHHSAGPVQGTVWWKQEHYQSWQWWVRLLNSQVIRKRGWDSWKRSSTSHPHSISKSLFCPFWFPLQMLMWCL